MIESPKAEQRTTDLSLATRSYEAILATMEGVEKAAVLLVTLGLDVSANIFKHLRQDEVEKVIVEIAKVGTVPLEKRDAVIAEAYQRAVALKYVREGGVEYTKEILERSLGSAEAADLSSRLFSSLNRGVPLEIVKRIEPSQLLQVMQNEHPQTIALLMVYMDPSQAGEVLSALTPDQQADVAMRIALLQKTPPEVLEQLDELLDRRLLLAGGDNAKEGGVQSLATVMNHVDRQTEKNILEGLGMRDPELAQEVKNLLFVFEDIAHLDDRSIQRVIKEVNSKDLALALKTATEELRGKVYKNMSQRAAENLKDDIEVLGPVRMRDVGKAQTAIVDVVRTLEESGEVLISRGAKDDQLV